MPRVTPANERQLSSMDETETAVKVRTLVDSLSPRTAHQYKSYNDKYIQWLREKKIIQTGVQSSVLYKDLPLSAHLVHWFLLDTLVPEDSGSGDDENDFKIATLKKIISSVKFLGKLCAIHGNASRIDEKYLESVIRLHSHWGALNRDSSLPLVKVSVNLWNDCTSSLPEKFFKTCLEKSRFLVDFHLRLMTNLSYDQRSKVKVSQLKPSRSNDGVVLQLKVWSSLQVYLPKSEPQIKSRMPVVLLPHDCPFLCPLTSLATYFYLRFYGVKTMTKGDGFPNLLSKAHSKDSWLDMPLIRGKSLSDYPRDETLSNYYSAVFRYCQLPYKRRDFFNKSAIEYPTWSNQDFVSFFQDFPQALDSTFVDNVPADYRSIMNFKNPYSRDGAGGKDSLPHSLLVQIFPEVESYRRQWDSLSVESQDFIKLMEVLRKRLLLGLPLIFKFFPNHDLFKDPIFQNIDFQSYFHDSLGKTPRASSLGSLPGFDPLTDTVFHNLLIEPTSIVEKSGGQGAELATVDADFKSTDVMKETFQFVQYQTLTNFQILISLLSKIFDRLEMKKSSREFMIHQLNLLLDTISEKITVSKPSDVENYVKKEEPSEDEKEAEEGGRANGKSRLDGLLAVEDDSSGDEAEDDGKDMQDELKFMINELVGERVRSTVNQQMEQWERKIQRMVNEAVELKIDAVLKRTRGQDVENESLTKRQRLSVTPSISKDESTPNPTSMIENDQEFKLDPDLNTVEAVILEWFTPNPDMGNECVHHMNKTRDKSWRSAFEKLYKERKLIVELYIHLVNERGLDRYKAVEVCESFRAKTEENNLRSLAQFLKDWKRSHESSFTGILEEGSFANEKPFK